MTGLPYKIATLLYAFNRQDEVLLMRRNKAPNLGLWSPAGGKLEQALGESPYQCAVRESAEELNLVLQPSDLHLTGLVSECGYEGEAHWLMFLFEIKPRLSELPVDMEEGHFQFFPRQQLATLPLPLTDKEKIWPAFWEHRHGFFAAHCHYAGPSTYQWDLYSSQPTPPPRQHS